jgi:DNA repair protein RecO (recombination protein O)
LKFSIPLYALPLEFMLAVLSLLACKMSSEKADALVLRVVEWSETSSIVTLFTREFGKVGAVAKGARRPKGPFESALDLLALCRIVFLHKSSDALDLLTEAKLLRRFRPPGHDLASLYAGYYVAELLLELTDEDDPHPELFDAADQTLLGLSSGGRVARLILRFEMTALRVLGHLPSLSQCADCSEPVVDAARMAFGLLDGGVLCGNCRVGKRQVVSVSRGVIEALRIYAEENDDAWQTTDPAGGLRSELRAVLNQYINHLVGHKLKLHDFLGTLNG